MKKQICVDCGKSTDYDFWNDRCLDCNIKLQEKDIDKEKMIASEALYGFAGWITAREERVVASSSDDAGIWAKLVDTFIKENKLTEPRDGWEHNLIHPSGECSGRA